MKLVVLLMALPMLADSQRRPDLSGTWVLESGFVSGSSRGGDGGSEPRPTRVHTSSGAAFNCGAGCRITQKGSTLTVDQAQLADYKGKDPSQVTPAVTFTLDGKDVKVVDTFSPSRTVPVRAAWQGATVRIDTGTSGIVMNQVLSLEGNRLVVVTTSIVGGQPSSTLTLNYKKK